MNGGGKAGLRRVAGTQSDLEGPAGYRVSLFFQGASVPVNLLSATYGGRSLTSRDSGLELIIVPGINAFICSLASPMDQEVSLFEKDASGHTSRLLQFQYAAPNPIVSVTIRGVEDLK